VPFRGAYYKTPIIVKNKDLTLSTLVPADEELLELAGELKVVKRMSLAG
jgi:hypothetical protein